MENKLSIVQTDEKIIRQDYRDPTRTTKRQINFIKASETEVKSTSQNRDTRSKSLGDSYLALVLPSESNLSGLKLSSTALVCPVCSLPLQENDDKHATSIAHQSCLPHNHVPSALNRKRKGFLYLEEYGWNADSRLGLGSEGREGRLYPVLPQPNEGRAGIAEKSDDSIKFSKLRANDETKVIKAKNAKDIRKDLKHDKKRKEQLHRLFFTDESVLKHLGEEF